MHLDKRTCNVTETMTERESIYSLQSGSRLMTVAGKHLGALIDSKRTTRQIHGSLKINVMQVKHEISGHERNNECFNRKKGDDR